MNVRRALVVLGTRPEAIKLTPLVRALRAASIETVVVSTGQHQEQLAQALRLFDLRPDVDLQLPPGQKLSAFMGRAVTDLGAVVRTLAPDVVIVQGDTSTTTAGALAGFYERVPVAHVEAGLRTYDLDQPFPEEGNRRIVSEVARWHFAPTWRAANQLGLEQLRGRIFVTGNTGIDALRWKAAQLGLGRTGSASGPRLVLVTMHRRESHGGPLLDVCAAVRELAGRGDLRILWPVHLNPQVRTVVERELAGVPGVEICPPLDYGGVLLALAGAHLVLTDSGGLQEEAPAFGVPVLVLRNTTERPEAVEAGVARIVGTDRTTVVQEASRLIDDAGAWRAMARGVSPYGDGRASDRIVEVLATGDLQEPFEAPLAAA